MTMFAPLPAQDLLPMELPSMSSPGASHAKTLALPENSAAWAKAPVPACGPRLSDLLATYDRATSSWRTSQHCLLAQVNGEADGLAEYSETWPSAGMMRNGKTYRRQPWALPIAENVSGLLPTPTATDGKGAVSGETLIKRMNHPRGVRLEEFLLRRRIPTPNTVSGHQVGRLDEWGGKNPFRGTADGKEHLHPSFCEWLMGFPIGWTDLAPVATPSSPKSPN
jgi:hypothetical protein